MGADSSSESAPVAAAARKAGDVDSVDEALASAARRSALGSVAPGEAPTGVALLRAVGGVRGILESILPGLVFLIVFAITNEAVVSVVAPVLLGLVFLVTRLVRREAVSGAIAGFVLLALSAGLALFTGRAEDNFILGFFINGVLVVVMLVSLAVRWPLIGVAVGYLAGDHPQWRQDRAKWRVATISTLLFAAFPALRLVIEVPLYVSGNAAALATTKLILGVPLYAGVLWITWLLVRTAWSFGRPLISPTDDSTSR